LFYIYVFDGELGMREFLCCFYVRILLLLATFCTFLSKKSSLIGIQLVDKGLKIMKKIEKDI
jgi:hypothetical protein